MLTFVGMTRKRSWVKMLESRNIGRIMQRGQLSLNSLYRGERWAFDNGAFQDWTNGRNFDADQHWRDIEAISCSGLNPIMAVVPDIVANERSLDFSLSWFDSLSGHPRSWAWYLAVQDGFREEDVAASVRQFGFRGLFLGGTNEFKRSEANKWRVLAHEMGIYAHYGRAGTQSKIRHAFDTGYDSLDSSGPLWERGRFKAFVDSASNLHESEQEQFEW